MLYFKLGWRSLWRNPKRTAIELASLAGAVFLCSFIVNLQTGVYPKYIEEAAQSGSGHVGFFRTNYLALRQTKLTFPAGRLVETLEREPGVERVFARIHLPGLARSSRDSRGAAMIALDFTEEKDTNPLLKTKSLVEGKLPARDDRWGAVMGKDLAHELGLKVGRKFVWMCQGHDGQTVSRLFRVRGIIKSGVPELDKSALLAHREAAAAMLGAEGQAHEVAVLLRDYKRTEEFLGRASKLASRLTDVEALPWQKSMPQIADGIRLDRTGGYIFLSFLLALVCLGTTNTMLMSVLDRSREFGVLRALGVTGGGVVRLILSEGLVLSLFGSALGLLAATTLNLYTSTKGIDFSGFIGEGQEFGGIFIDPIAYSGWDWPRMAVLVCIMAMLALLASLYPTWKAVQIRPADAMRSY